jgi:carboxylesterase
VPLLPGAEPYRHEGGPTGVLLCHGFTGSPQSMRPWAEHLAARGLTVSVPLLPGHGTRWQDLQVTGWPDWYAEVDREFGALARECERVVVCGLSMGGALALLLAARHGPAVAGVALVNPSVKADGAQVRAVPLLRHVVPSVPGIASDIAKGGVEELGYDRTPLHAVYSLTRLWRQVQAELPRVDQPLLVFTSRVDHVVHPSNSELVLARTASRDVTHRVLERSYHVATLDHDAPGIFAGTAEFVERLAPVADAPTGGDEVARGGA